MFKRLLIIGLILVAIVGALGVWGFVSFRRQPIASLEKLTRLSLKFAGAERQSLETSHGTLVYFTLGEGPTVFLLHGANDQAGLWAKSASRLKGSYRFVIPDMPGHGESEPATGPIRFAMMLDAVEALKAKESPNDSVAIVGNSMGGWISLLYALEHPDNVRQLVLEDSGGISLDQPVASLLPTTREEAREAFDATVARTPVPDFIVDDFVRRASTSQVARLSDEDFDSYILDDRLGELGVPTTLIWGEEDRLLDLEFAKRMESMIPGAVLKTLPGCGHIPHNECHAEFAKLLGQALKGETR